MKLTRKRIHITFQILLALDKPISKASPKRFDFSRKGNYALGRHLRAMKSRFEEIEEERGVMQKEFDPERKTSEVIKVDPIGNPIYGRISDEKQAEWDARHKAYMAEEVDYESPPVNFKYSDLQPEKNPDLQQVAINELFEAGILEDDFKEEEAK